MRSAVGFFLRDRDDPVSYNKRSPFSQPTGSPLPLSLSFSLSHSRRNLAGSCRHPIIGVAIATPLGVSPLPPPPLPSSLAKEREESSREIWMNGGDVIRDEFFTTSSSPLVCLRFLSSSIGNWKELFRCSWIDSTNEPCFSILSKTDKSFSSEWKKFYTQRVIYLIFKNFFFFFQFKRFLSFRKYDFIICDPIFYRFFFLLSSKKTLCFRNQPSL